jgi:hypothetical protein
MMANTTIGGINHGSQPMKDSVNSRPRSTIQVIGLRMNVNSQ